MQPQVSLRAILFDIDGTLIDTVNLIVNALDYTYRKHLGITLSREELRRLIGLPLKVQMRYLDDRVPESPPHEQMEADEMAYYAAHRDQERVVPEAVEAVRTAYRKGYATALVTSKSRAELALSSLPKLELEAFVDAIVTADDTERHKPAPDPVLKALERLQVAPEQAVYIGDTVFDVACGRAAGVQVGTVAWGAHLPEDLRAAQPDYYFETPADLLQWIEQLPVLEGYGEAEAEAFQSRTRRARATTRGDNH
ncbi:MAG: HAD-IA family hydrolase [Fimbriimonadales bacterium]|nr:HAD-IA family hydrolase [Fimbriimonadales bacterium]MDW8051654.1 HAD-IA family hydrolase [Armatimonadota bacterium]